jgi:PAS domain S-box-containing protein/putative nucleotidyltransferase with HDIG domain
MQLPILFIEDNPDDVELMLRHLRRAGIEPRWRRVATEPAVREALVQDDWGVALVDYNLPSFGGRRALEIIAEAAPALPAITVSGAISEETAVATLTAGAIDYVLKDNLTRLAPAVRRAVEGADLRRRKHAADELARQNQFAVEHSSQAVAYVDEDGVILYMNRVAEELAGMAREDLAGRHIWGWSPLVDEETWARLWREARDGPVSDVEAPVETPDGRRLLVSVSLDHLQRDEGDFMIVYVRDITRQRESEERARETEERYGRLTDNLADIIFRYELEPERRLAYINPAVETITGYTPDECYADPALMVNLAHPEDAHVMAAAFEALEVPASPVVMRWIGKDGTVRWMESRLVPVCDASGRLTAVEGVTRDITAVREATERLAHSRDLLDYVVSNAGSAIAIHDRDLRYIYVSGRYLRDYGVTEPDVVGKHHYDVFPDLPQKWRDAHQRALRGEVLSADRDPYPRADGSLMWTRWLCRPWYEADGSIGGIIVYTEVITDAVEAELALRTSELHLRTLVDTLPDLVWLKDAEGVYLSCNRRFEQFFGAPVEEIVGKTDHDFVARELADSFRVHDLAAMRAGGPSANEEEIVFAADGHTEILETIKTPLVAADGEVIGVLGVGRDITKRKRAERELAESHELLANLARLVPGVVYQYRLWPDGRSAFPYASPGMNDIYEVTPEEVREDATPVFGRLHPDDYDRVAEAIEHSARTLETFYCEFRVVLPRQGLRWRWSQAHPERTEDGGTLWHGIISDVTHRKLADEEIRRQADQLKRTLSGAVLAIGKIVESRDPYTAGHELRVTELAVAIGAEMGMDGEELEGLRLAGLLHDIGKIAVPAEILSKPGRLSPVEFSLVKQHPQAGYDILAGIDFSEPVAPTVLQHHERFDGSGYPQGLEGDDILLTAQVLMVADVVEAMASHRPYRPSLGLEAALAEVRDGEGVRYAAPVVAACLRAFERGFEFADR